MKVVKEELRKVINEAKGFVSNRALMPVLENFKFDCDGSKLTITASDLANTYVNSIACEGEANTFCVDANMFSNVINQCKNDNVVIDFSLNGITIKNGRKRFKLPIEEGSDFPIPSFDEEIRNEFSLDFNLIKKALVSVSNDELRPNMNGVLISNDIVSTDGHRMFVSEFADANIEHDIIVPSKALRNACNIFNDNAGVKSSFSKIIFEQGSKIMYSKLIDESFPAYKNVLPQSEFKVVVNASHLNQSVKAVSICANKSTHQVKLDVSNESIVITSEDMDIGSGATDSVICDAEKDIEIGFDAKLLSDILSQYGDKNVVLEFSAPERPCIIRDSEFFYLIMPIVLHSV